jgi:conjugative transfer signal peptidase TraF
MMRTAVACALAAALIGIELLPRAFGWYLNVTTSMPLGYYATDREAAPRVGDIVTVCLTHEAAAFFHDHHLDIPRGSCPRGTSTLTKHMEGGEGARFGVDERGVWVDGRLIPHSAPLPATSNGIVLPRAAATVVPAGYVVALSPTRRSMDSRYFGPLRLVAHVRPVPWSAVVGVYVLMLLGAVACFGVAFALLGRTSRTRTPCAESTRERHKVRAPGH